MKTALIISVFCITGIAAGYDIQPRYAYKYEVKDEYSGQEFGLEEAREGYNTDGKYKVLLPDGRTQIVEYNVANPESGFIADVRYEGEALAYSAPSLYKPVLPTQHAHIPSLYAPQYSSLPTSYEPIQAIKPIQPIRLVKPVQPVKPIRFSKPETLPLFYGTLKTTTPSTTTDKSITYTPSSLRKVKKMKIIKRLNVNELNLSELFYGDLSKAKFHSNKKLKDSPKRGE